MKKNLKYLGLAALIFLLGFGAARHTTPVKIVTQTKQVVKTKKDVITVTKRVKLPDGTITTETRKEDRSTTDKNKEFNQIVENEKAQWRANVLYSLTKTNNYGASVERRILGPVFAGAYGFTDGNVGISVGLEW